MKDEITFIPKYKYPDGNYQIILNEEIIQNTDENLLNSIKNNDINKYSLSFGKLKNLNNILIPYNLNPLNYYYMIGKIEFLLYFDFINDTYYFQSISYAECFMALYVPKSYCKLIEENQTYGIFKITHYIMIYHDFKDENKIKQNIKSWLNVEDDEINVDQYHLYYWINVKNINDKFYKNVVNNLIELDSFYSYINLSISGKIYDDVSIPIEENNKLNWTANDIIFTLLNEKPNKVNYINWEKTSDWMNFNNIQNSLFAEILGNGIIKITKQHFKNVTGVDLDLISSGTLTKEQLLKLNINEPDLPTYNRFQYWLKSDKF